MKTLTQEAEENLKKRERERRIAIIANILTLIKSKEEEIRKCKKQIKEIEEGKDMGTGWALDEGSPLIR